MFFKDFIQALNMILWSSIETNRCKWSGMITYAPTHARIQDLYWQNREKLRACLQWQEFFAARAYKL